MKERKRRKSYLISAFVATKAEWKIRIYSADSYDREESEANAILIDGKADAASLYLGAWDGDLMELWASVESPSYQVTNFWSWD